MIALSWNPISTTDVAELMCATASYMITTFIFLHMEFTSRTFHYFKILQILQYLTIIFIVNFKLSASHPNVDSCATPQTIISTTLRTLKLILTAVVKRKATVWCWTPFQGFSTFNCTHQRQMKVSIESLSPYNFFYVYLAK